MNWTSILARLGGLFAAGIAGAFAVGATLVVIEVIAALVTQPLDESLPILAYAPMRLLEGMMLIFFLMPLMLMIAAVTQLPLTSITRRRPMSLRRYLGMSALSSALIVGLLVIINATSAMVMVGNVPLPPLPAGILLGAGGGLIIGLVWHLLILRQAPGEV